MTSNSKSKRLNHESDTEANALGRSERACGAHKKSSVWIHPMNLSNPQKLEPAPGLPVGRFVQDRDLGRNGRVKVAKKKEKEKDILEPIVLNE